MVIRCYLVLDGLYVQPNKKIKMSWTMPSLHDWQLITLRLHVLKYNMNNFILSQNSNIVKVVTDILRLL